DRAAGERAEVAETGLRSLTAGEVEELADDGRHARRLLQDDARVVRALAPAALGGGDPAGPAGDDVERRAELVRDAGREPPDGGQAICVPELLERRDARLGLGAAARLRLRDAVAHGVHLLAGHPDLVMRPEAH